MNRGVLLRRSWIGLVLPLLVLLWPLAAPAENLYVEGQYRSLGADNKAWRVGDTLTVLIVENSSATSNAETTDRRRNQLNAQLTRASHDQFNTSASVSGDFDGGGRTQRAGKLVGQVTATVTEVLANGQLRLAGSQDLRVNDEQQRIQLDGTVRPQDISDGNVVLSNRIADANIRYNGEGILSERQRRAWWRSALDWLGF